jgi:F-type H+-transporting ATPase subunit b
MLIPTNFAAENSSGLGALGVDGRAFLIQLITFVLAFLILKRYAFGPILRVLAERRQIIEQGVRLGEEMQKEKAKLEAQVAKVLREARLQADEIISVANDTSRQTIREAEEKARLKAAAIIETAEARLVQDMARARQQLERELAGLVADATEALIEEKVDAKKDAQLIERALKESRAA